MKTGAKVLLVHNRYQQRGGEDVVFEAEQQVLRERDHDVVTFVADNDAIRSMHPLRLAGRTLWNVDSRRAIGRLIDRERPHVVHFHNTFPLVSPAGYHAAKERGLPVVQTLHNFRLLCTNALLFRDGKACEECLTRRSVLPAVRHACYRGSRTATAVTASMLSLHRTLGTWTSAVDVYLALTNFARTKFIEGGLPADRILVKPNFLAHDPGPGPHRGGFALFVGRLSPEKGIGTLVEAWRRLRTPFPLKVVGGGPLESLAASAPPNVEFLGPLPLGSVMALLKEAAFLMYSSECFEGGFPMSLMEGIATGLPVVGAAQAAVSEVLEHGISAVLCEPSNPDALAVAVDWALTHPEELKEIGWSGRQVFLENFTAEQHYLRIAEIYERAGRH